MISLLNFKHAGSERVILDPPRKARARSPNLQRAGVIASMTSSDVTRSTDVVLARWFHFFDAKPKNVHFWCPKLESRYRPLEWLIQLTSIFFRVPPNLSVKVPVEQQRCNAAICCTGKSDYNPKKRRRGHKITSCSFSAVRRKERFAQLDPPRKARARSASVQCTGLIDSRIVTQCFRSWFL